MERVMQYLDDLEDLVCAAAVAAARTGRTLVALLCLLLALATPLGIVLLAFVQPPLGLAAATMLSVILLYRAVVTGPPRRAAVLEPVSQGEGQLQPH